MGEGGGEKGRFLMKKERKGNAWKDVVFRKKERTSLSTIEGKEMKRSQRA